MDEYKEKRFEIIRKWICIREKYLYENNRRKLWRLEKEMIKLGEDFYEYLMPGRPLTFLVKNITGNNSYHLNGNVHVGFDQMSKELFVMPVEKEDEEWQQKSSLIRFCH